MAVAARDTLSVRKIWSIAAAWTRGHCGLPESLPECADSVRCGASSPAFLLTRSLADLACTRVKVSAAIASLHAQLDSAHTLDDIRKIEAFAAMAYWGAWQSVQAAFPRHQLSRVPAHWQTFASRHSTLTGSPRLATDLAESAPSDRMRDCLGRSCPRKATPTTLTQSRKRIAQGGAPGLPPAASPQPPKVCRLCGSTLKLGTHCTKCAVVASTEALVMAARKGRVVSQQPAAQAKRTATRLRNALAEREWSASDLPRWLTEGFYDEQIRSQLSHLTNRAIRSALGVSEVYAIRIRHGKVRPHPRHWLSLAILLGKAEPQET